MTDTSGAPIADICVMPSGLEEGKFTDPSWQEMTVTDENGEYLLSEVGDSTLALYFSECIYERTLASEWYPDKASRHQATLFTVEGDEDITGIDAVMDEGGSISGKVTDPSGKPVRRICVRAFEEDGKWWPERHTRTDDQGNYALDALHSGSYRVEYNAACDGEAPRPFATEWFNDRAHRRGADLIGVAEGQATRTDVQLGSGSSFVGFVRDRQGRPASGVEISIVDESRDGRGSAHSRADGSYRFNFLHPGRYTMDFWSDEFEYTWYGGGWELEEAEYFDVHAGTNQIDVTLHRNAPIIEMTDGSTVVAENGQSDRISITLDDQPTDPLKMYLRDPDRQVRFEPDVLHFDQDNHLVPQTVEVWAMDDRIREDNHIAKVSPQFSGGDTGYSWADQPWFDVEILDDGDVAELGKVSVGTRSGYRGETVRLWARFTDPETSSPITDARVLFRIGDLEAEGLTGPDGSAEVDMKLDLPFGRHPMEVTADTDRWTGRFRDEFKVSWEFFYNSPEGMLWVNSYTSEFWLQVDGFDSGVRTATSMHAKDGSNGNRAIHFAHQDLELSMVGRLGAPPHPTSVFVTGRTPKGPFTLERNWKPEIPPAP